MLRPPRNGLLVAALFAALLAVGCAGARAYDAPLAACEPGRGYGKADLGTGDMLLALAFSGGGTRAAAFAYGVLEELRATEVVVSGDRKRLLDEVDLISSVSGGSFTSAYYGLYGDRIFEDFEERFLKQNVQSRLIIELFRPANWWRFIRGAFSRSEIAIELYDRKIFDGATFADLEAAGGPLLQINATDLSVGNRFTFVQRQFDLLCSDLSPLHVSRAVTASSAVPVVFPPISIRNHAGACGYELPGSVQKALTKRRQEPRAYFNAEIMRGYVDGNRPFVHLVDGGISDNLGLRAALDGVFVQGSAWKALREVGADRPSRIAFVVVNSEVSPSRGMDLLERAPSMGAILNSVSGAQINRYNFETVELLRTSMRSWPDEFPRDENGQKVEVFLIELSFDLLEDPIDRAFFNSVPTSFNLPDETVDRLREAARHLLKSSEEFQRLLHTMQPPARG